MQKQELDDSSNLDVVRTLAVTFVVISHLPLPPLLGNFLPYHNSALGLLGVALFFVHTSLVLMLSLQRQTQRYGEKHRALQFFIRRVFRIYPLSLSVVIFLVILEFAYSAEPPVFSRVASNLLLIQNLTGDISIPSPLWSLPFELQMYLFLPTIYFSLQSVERKFVVAAFLAVWVASICFVILLHAIHFNYHLAKYVPCFIPGILAYALRDRARLFSPAVLVGYIISVAIVFPVAVEKGIPENIAAWPICLVLGFLIPVCRELQSRFFKKITKTIATYSYGIYLVHQPCINLSFDILNISVVSSMIIFGTYIRA